MHSRHPPGTPRIRRGFTLVELFVVITIIIVLASLMPAVMDRVRQNANMSRCAQHLRTWGVAIHGYAADPALLLLMADTDGTFQLNGPEDLAKAIAPICTNDTPRHRRSVNVLFGDGHVASYRGKDIDHHSNQQKVMLEPRFTTN